jgi:hypothetical protein
MAVRYILLMSAKRNVLKPYAWLKNALPSLLTQNNKDIAQWLPFNTFQFINTIDA